MYYYFLVCCLFVFLWTAYLFSFLNDAANSEIYTLSLHDALPISRMAEGPGKPEKIREIAHHTVVTTEILADILEFFRSEEHTSELQSLRHLVCRLLLEKKKKKKNNKQM